VEGVRNNSAFSELQFGECLVLISNAIITVVAEATHVNCVAYQARIVKAPCTVNIIAWMARNTPLSSRNYQHGWAVFFLYR